MYVCMYFIKYSLAEAIKRVLNYRQTSVLFLHKGATFVDKRANGFYMLAGSPASGLILNPLVAYTSTTVYI